MEEEEEEYSMCMSCNIKRNKCGKMFPEIIFFID